MNIAPKKFYAASSAHFCVGSSVRSFAVGCLLCGAMGCVWAGPGDGPRGDMRQDMRQMQRQDSQRFDTRSLQGSDQVQIDPRSFEGRAEEQRRLLQLQEQNRADAVRRSGRMTPDERRDLRRQINEAGQDLYRDPPRR